MSKCAEFKKKGKETLADNYETKLATFIHRNFIKT